jgi:hypothetical protein
MPKNKMMLMSKRTAARGRRTKASVLLNDSVPVLEVAR